MDGQTDNGKTICPQSFDMGAWKKSFTDQKTKNYLQNKLDEFFLRISGQQIQQFFPLNHFWNLQSLIQKKTKFSPNFKSLTVINPRAPSTLVL